jgi:hypothetical protein
MTWFCIQKLTNPPQMPPIQVWSVLRTRRYGHETGVRVWDGVRDGLIGDDPGLVADQLDRMDIAGAVVGVRRGVGRRGGGG